MSQFDSAIALVHESLRLLCERKETQAPRASLGALQRLAAAAESKPKVVAADQSSSPPAPTQKRGETVLQSLPTAAQAQPASEAERKTSLSAMAKAAMLGGPLPATADPTPVSNRADSGPRSSGQTAGISLTPKSAANLPKEERMQSLQQQAVACTRCASLVDGRTQVIFGTGNLYAELLFIVGAPGSEEDAQGVPLAGKAGELWQKIIEAMGFKPAQVYLCPALKCRTGVPPAQSSADRAPAPEELANCLPFVVEQIEIIQPKCIVTLGQPALEGLLAKEFPYGLPRGKWQGFHGIPVMPTYHPGYLLENQTLSEKRKLWEDMLQVLELLGRTVTPKQRGFFLPRPGAEG